MVGLGEMDRDMMFCSLSSCLPAQSGLWVLRECLLLLYWGKQQVVGRRFGAEDLCDPLEMGAGGEAAGGVLLQNW